MAAKTKDGSAAKPAAMQPFGVFGSLEFRTNATAGLDQWRRYQKQTRSNRKSFAACVSSDSACAPQLREWRRQVKHWRTLDGLDQLSAVNSWFNRNIRYRPDDSQFGVADRWLTLAASLKSGGDCEDYALAKYETLKALGYDENRLRLVIVNDTRKAIGHAVLTVATGDGLFVLDNQNKRVLRHDAISYYAPIYSINDRGRWLNIATRKIKSKYIFALEQGSDPAIATRKDETPEQSAGLTPPASDVPLLRQTIIDADSDLTVVPASDVPPLRLIPARDAE